MFEARYNDLLENIDLDKISLRFPVESLKRPGIYSDSIVNVYKNAGPLRWYNDYSKRIMFVIHSHKALGNNLDRLSRNSYARYMTFDFLRDDFFKGFISKDEVDFLKETPETLLEILINPETTPNFGIYLEMKLLKQFNLI